MIRRTLVLLPVILALALWALWPDRGESFATGQKAPEISGGPWINTQPLSLSDLKGRVILVEFWTYGWINCKNVIPWLRDWYDKYENKGFTIVGVHSPEFAWEKPLDKVRAAMAQLGIRYPVVQDNNFEIWKRYGIWAWPTTILIDKKGIIRYAHIGEGAYVKTESVIKQLLQERL
jgi:peroxiredoxin